MKPVGRNTRFVLFICLWLRAIAASAITFTSNTYIGPTDFSSDGQDIIVTNCTLTVDGAHGFNSLQLLTGGVLSHSAFTNGPGQIIFVVNNESQMLTATNFATLVNTNVNTNTIVVMDDTSSITYTQNVDYLVTVSNQFTELSLTTNSSITPGATVLVSYDWSQLYLGLTLTISNNMDVTPGGLVNLSGMGYAGGNGFSNGVGTSQSTNYLESMITVGGGGGHGGCGGMANATVIVALGGASYDSTTNPANLGSGGGAGFASGGAGGGLGQFFVDGTLQVDGQILADGLAGTNGNSGGGAGGGLLLSAQTFSGAGSISAQGGAGNPPELAGVGGGGGGGVIAIYSDTNTFTGSVVAYGGAGANYGGAGTILTTSFTNGTGQLLIANNGNLGTNTFFFAPAVSNLTISGGSVAQPLNSFTISNLFVGSKSILLPQASGSLVVTVNGDATVEPNAFIDADSQSASGFGAGSSSCGAGGGGSYSGTGGTSACGSTGGFTYGSVSQPTALGSPGGGSPVALGGGAIQLTVAGTLSLSGQISANGAGGTGTNGGGGSGGSVWLTVGTISGGGLISANGGAANNPLGGGGGGGLIALYFSTNSFVGPITSYGGAGTNAGGAGSIYLRTNGSTSAQIIFDNNGLSGSTPLPSAGNQADVTAKGGAILTVSSSLVTLRSLLLASNSFVVGGGSIVPILTTSNLTIQSGAGFIADSQSFTSLQPGSSVNLTGGGGGNGGCGGASVSNAPGGGSVLNSGNLYSIGSPGGSGQSGQGGRGGGVFNMTVSGTLQLDGTISANGGTSASLNSGGGSGGGMKLIIGTLSGAGSISANGGAANNLGGGGGGGRMAIYYQTNLFTGTVTAYGGPGANYGGAGTIYEAQTATLGGNPVYQQLLIDNGGIQSTNTIFPTTSISGVFDLIMRGGAVVDRNFSTMTNGNLTIGSNTVFLLNSTAQVIVDVLTNATIQAGGAIRNDGATQTTGGSTGQSLNSTGGGGGDGGVGGSSSLGAQGGTVALDYFTAPSSVGASGGRGGGSNSQGGNGGGGIRLIVNGALQLDGLVSAQGTTGPGTNSGGGSGGSVTLNVGTISGLGTVSVNGGAANAGGGGGSGGRIAVNYSTNLFTGILTAYGGAGAQYGGAGTVYTTSSFSGNGSFDSLLVDNGGFSGQQTLVDEDTESPVSDLKVTHGAILTVGSVDDFMTWGDLLIGSNSSYILANPFVSVLTNATIQFGATLTVPPTGSGSTPGQNGFHGAGGGGHGGFGGFGLTPSQTLELGGSVYDSVTRPTQPGGSGGYGEVNGSSPGGFGGGGIQLSVNGILQLDGTCSANGGAASSTNSGGGAGGAILIKAGEFLGLGTVSANGGAGFDTNGIGGGGGGGGRIAVWVNTNSFSGTTSVRGGAGVQYGGPGTIYFNSSINGNGNSSQLVIDNTGSSNGATAGMLSPVNGLDVVLTNGGSLGVDVTGSMNWNSLSIASNCSLTLASNSMSLNLTVNSNVIIQPTAAIDFDGQGFSGGAGNGQGGVFGVSTAGGGGHGGMGSAGTNAAARGGISYDSITAPVSPGGCGGASTPGSAGGGALELTVNGLLQVDGTITANGQTGAPPQNPYAGGGGGAGGSLWLTAGTFSGAGSVSANGGNGVITNSGGGGGGRIAVYFNSNTFTGTFSAHGGAGVMMPGGAGTIFLQSNSAPVGQLSLDNGGAPGTNTPLDSLAQTLPLSISNGAAASSGVPLTLQSLSIGSNALFTANSLQSLSLTVLGNAFVDTNGAIAANGTGYNPAPGPGPGSGAVDSGFNGSGGGYGGFGGNSFLGAAGGVTYGSSNQPINFGSAGGVSNSPVGFSQGGGAIRLIVDNTLTLNGSIAANGNNATTTNAGGGSGGSIWLTAQSLAGDGTFTANGGSANGQGGGGGGGRIAIYANTNLFFGSAASSGGTGAFAGQPGTVVFATNLLVSGDVTDTNGNAISDVTLQPSGLAAVATDINGSYSVPVPLFWNGTVAPTSAGFYLPNLRTYSNLASNAPSQNYLATVPTAFNIGSTQFDGTNLNFSWYGINGVTYQPLYSSNLVNWLPYGPAFIGSNAPVSVAIPVSTAPQLFFRLTVSY